VHRAKVVHRVKLVHHASSKKVPKGAHLTYTP